MGPSRLQRLQASIKDDLQSMPALPPKHDNENSMAELSRGMGSLTLPDGPLTEDHSGPAEETTETVDQARDEEFESEPESSPKAHFEEAAVAALSSQLTQHAEHGFQTGQLAALGQEFCPILPVSKFPYKFVDKSRSDKVAKAFFDAGKFWGYEWQLYYIWPPQDIADKPLILIRSDQFLRLVEVINKAFKGLNFRITDKHYDEGLVLRIPHPALAPRYLGKSKSRNDYNDMERTVPPRGYRINGEQTLPRPDERTLEAFKQKIEDAIELNKMKNKAAKAKKKDQRIQSQQNWGRQLKRTQRYLGLRPRHDENASASGRIPTINPQEPASYPFDSSVVFVCVDIEAYERAHSKITEIGLAIVDCNDLHNIAPGKNGQNWFNMIRARHFRISEHSHLNNSEFVNGCADRFEFGQSEFVSLRDAPAAVAACFREPFCSPGLGAKSPIPILNSDGKRNVVFVGHDAGQDINYLNQLGYNPLNLSNLLEVMDTALLYRAWKRETQPRSLANCLYDLDLVGWNLHNAGNDAVYTMHVLLALCVRQASERGTPEEKAKRQEESTKQISEAVTEAVTATLEKQEGWDSAEEGADSGVPKNTVAQILVSETPRSQKKTRQESNQLNARVHQDLSLPVRLGPSPYSQPDPTPAESAAAPAGRRPRQIQMRKKSRGGQASGGQQARAAENMPVAEVGYIQHN